MSSFVIMAKVPETSLTSLLNIVFDSGRPQSLQKKKSWVLLHQINYLWCDYKVAH